MSTVQRIARNTTLLLLSSVASFVLGFFFIQDIKSKTMRKIAWIAMAVSFAGMALYRTIYLPAGQSLDVAQVQMIMFLYFIGVCLCIAALFFDGTLKRLRYMIKTEKSKADLSQLNYLKRKASIKEKMKLFDAVETKKEAKDLAASIKKDVDMASVAGEFVGE